MLKGSKHKPSTIVKLCTATQGKNNPMYGKKHKPETIAKLRTASTGKKHSLKTRKKMSLSHTGKKFSIESRAKMSQAQKGRIISPEHCLKISIAKTGTKMSAETRQKISCALKNRIFSAETRKKISEARKGKRCGTDHYQWRGGPSIRGYCWVWHNTEFKESIRQRDNYQCQNPYCWNKSITRKLDIHHIDYNRKNCHPLNLITLCRSCNIRANTNRNYWENLYQNIILD